VDGEQSSDFGISFTTDISTDQLIQSPKVKQTTGFTRWVISSLVALIPFSSIPRKTSSIQLSGKPMKVSSNGCGKKYDALEPIANAGKNKPNSKKD